MASAAKVILEITSRPLSPKPTLLLYRFVQLLALPFFVLWLLARALREPAYRSHLGERFGFLPDSFTRTKAGALWLHAVSVGEVASVLPLLRALKDAQPAIPVYLSTSTVAGRKAAVQQASSLVDGIFYAPFDFGPAVRRALRLIRPALLVVLETEIWPNLYAETKRTGAQLAVVNGRISERTWPRYRAWKHWFAPIVQLPDALWVQSEADRERYLELGAPAERLAIGPNLKYDAARPATPLRLDSFGARQVWIAASTVGPNERGSLQRHGIDEDEIVIRAFQSLAAEFPRLLLVLAPRQPQRFERAASLLVAAGVRFVRRTATKNDPALTLELPGVLLLDTVGELASLYGLANVAFVGGSLAPRGGHNFLEPAAAGVPVVTGPHLENFRALQQDFSKADALRIVQNGDELLTAVRGLLREDGEARRLGERGRGVVEARRGGSVSLARELWLLYYAASLRKNRNRLTRAFLAPLAGLWEEGGTLKRRRSEQFTLLAPPLSVPVISVGGITVGGSGKTPFAVYLATELNRRGYRPAILTRGYRRQLPAETLIVPAGAKIPSAVTGDEAQIFLRTGQAPVGIGANRYNTARILLRQIPSTDVLVLDDGFQHAKVLRDANLVVIDGLDPFGGEEVVPLGRLREPLEALARADAFIVNRAENDLRFEAIGRRLAKLNPAAPVFRARQRKRSWHDYFTGRPIDDLRGRRAGAFCGLGNPRGFWHTLDDLGVEVVFRWQFPDHHVYTPLELQRVAHQAWLHGAEFLVTTEKDRINGPWRLERASAPLDFAWLAIELTLEDEARFFAFLEKLLHATQARDALPPKRTPSSR